jgi:hypothetical protein
MTTQDKVRIRADVPLDWHGDAVRMMHGVALNVPSTLGSSLLNTAADALDALYTTFGSVQDAHKAAIAAAAPGSRVDSKGRAHGNLRLSAAGYTVAPERERELADAMQLAFDRVMPKVERCLNLIRQQRATIANNVAKALDDRDARTAAGIALAQEVRAHMKELPKTERAAFALAAVHTGDKGTVHALLSAPAFLSGLEPDSHGAIRQAAAAKFAPVDHAQVTAADKVISHVERAAESFVKKFAALRPKVSSATSDAIARLVSGRSA